MAQDQPLVASENADSPQLSGTVVDIAGGVIVGASVVVQDANGTLLMTTQSDENGFFVISGLRAGN